MGLAGPLGSEAAHLPVPPGPGSTSETSALYVRVGPALDGRWIHALGQFLLRLDKRTEARAGPAAPEMSEGLQQFWARHLGVQGTILPSQPDLPAPE